MSLWIRLRGALGLGTPRPEEGAGPARPDGVAAPRRPKTPELTPLEFIEEASRGGVGVGEEALEAALDSLLDTVDEGRAIELLRRLMARSPSWDSLGLKLAERLSYRGDDGAALEVLTPLLRDAAVSSRALVLAGEVSERSGDGARARLHYQAALARDVDLAGIRERVERLGIAASRAPRGAAGATLATEGAVARGRYQVERELGRGGAGTVFAATDVHLERRVALKVYHRRGSADLERLRLEARSPAQLEHPGVIRIFDIDEELGAIAMEWVRGGALKRHIDRGSLALEDALLWVRTLVEALGFVHARGVVHRDLKPSNVLIRDDGRAVLTDFGLAMDAGEAPAAGVVAAEGTLRYMPPEQGERAPAHPASDMHALGVTLAELFEAVAGPTPPEIEEWVASSRRKEPGARPGLPELLSALEAHRRRGA